MHTHLLLDVELCRNIRSESNAQVMNEQNLVNISGETSSRDVLILSLLFSFEFAWNFNSIKLHAVCVHENIQKENPLEFDNNRCA